MLRNKGGKFPRWPASSLPSWLEIKARKLKTPCWPLSLRAISQPDQHSCGLISNPKSREKKFFKGFYAWVRRKLDLSAFQVSPAFCRGSFSLGVCCMHASALFPSKHLSSTADFLWYLRYHHCHLLHSILFLPFNWLPGRENESDDEPSTASILVYPSSITFLLLSPC